MASRVAAMRGSTAALMAAALLMLLVSPEAPDAYEQETRRMFAEWKAKYRKTYKYAGEECRYAVFKEARRRVARAHAAGVTTSDPWLEIARYSLAIAR